MARIISGKARNTKLDMPEGLHTRPTGERVKEAVFSALQFEIAGSNFLDLYAGSGQMGLEAASRGAEVVMVEPHLLTFKILKGNLLRSNLNVEVYKTRDRIAIGKFIEQGRVFDLVYCDPPWDQLDNTFECPELRGKISSIIKPNGKLLLEAPSKVAPIIPKGLELIKQLRYGNTAIYFYQRLQ